MRSPAPRGRKKNFPSFGYEEGPRGRRLLRLETEEGLRGRRLFMADELERAAIIPSGLGSIYAHSPRLSLVADGGC